MKNNISEDELDLLRMQALNEAAIAIAKASKITGICINDLMKFLFSLSVKALNNELHK
jgi:hypothetical protein